MGKALSFIYLIAFSIGAALVIYLIPFIFLFATLFVYFIFDISFVDPIFNDTVTKLLLVVTIGGIIVVWIITVKMYIYKFGEKVQVANHK